jgi:hypothetical protein
MHSQLAPSNCQSGDGGAPARSVVPSGRSRGADRLKSAGRLVGLLGKLEKSFEETVALSQEQT